MDLDALDDEISQVTDIQNELSLWIKKEKQLINGEISQIAKQISEKEENVAKQNKDLQESYLKYISLTKIRCETSLNSIIELSSNNYLNSFREKINTLNHSLENQCLKNQKRIEEIKSMELIVEKNMQIFSRYIQNSNKVIENYKKEYRNSIVIENESLIIGNHIQLRNQRIKEIEEKFEKTMEKLERKKDISIKSLDFILNTKKEETNRLVKLTEELKDNITNLMITSKSQTSIKKCSFVREVGVDIPPASSKRDNRQSFKKLVVLAPIRHLGKRVFKS